MAGLFYFSFFVRSFLVKSALKYEPESINYLALLFKISELFSNEEFINAEMRVKKKPHIKSNKNTENNLFFTSGILILLNSLKSGFFFQE